LVELKRLMELVEGGGGRLAVVLAGHPKLRNDLRRPTMEEIVYRTEVFSLDGIAGSQREYIRWLLGTCATDKKDAETILTVEAIDVLASMLRTPLQIQMHLNLALDASYQSGERPVSVELGESVLSRQIDDLEPTLTRHGYSIKDLLEQFDSNWGALAIAGMVAVLLKNRVRPQWKIYKFRWREAMQVWWSICWRATLYGVVGGHFVGQAVRGVAIAAGHLEGASTAGSLATWVAAFVFTIVAVKEALQLHVGRLSGATPVQSQKA
jgi:hypothetical protein